jgi:hypothetical protein
MVQKGKRTTAPATEDNMAMAAEARKVAEAAKEAAKVAAAAKKAAAAAKKAADGAWKEVEKKTRKSRANVA